MKVFSLLVTILFVNCCIRGQDTAMPARFACVSIPHYDYNSWGNIDCISYYSNGHVENLGQMLDFSNNAKDYRNDSIIAQYEFKILGYFYDRGYELLSILQQRPSVRRQFYFKHK